MTVKKMNTNIGNSWDGGGISCIDSTGGARSNDTARDSEEEPSHHRRLPCAACYPTPALLNLDDGYGGDDIADGADPLRYPSGSFV